MNKEDYRKVMVEVMLVESLTTNATRFDLLLKSGFSLAEVVSVSRAMKSLVDKGLEQVVQRLLDKQEEPPPSPPPSPPTTSSFFDPSMN